MKLWGGRFEKATSKTVDDFNSSIRFDRRLFRHDIKGSIAHAKMLGARGIIPGDEAAKITATLLDILADIESGKAELLVDAEDIHMNIEKILTERIGEAGGRLHTGRSRNDQVALDFRMFVKEEIDAVCGLLTELSETILTLAEENVETIMPGYTHLQRAQPVTLAHHLMAYFEMLARDRARLSDCRARADVMPLGSGALAATTYPLDREMAARELGFSKISQNSLDAVSDRDFAAEFIFCLSMIMMHLSRFCEELILWSSHEFSFIEMDDAYSTGSSIMPQKKNPDVAELIRGKTGRVYGSLTALLTMMKGLPLAYNKDMQEDKEPVFDAVDTVGLCLNVFGKMLKTVKINRAAMLNAAKGGFTNATDVADYLVKKGLPFRKAHEIVGRLVLYAIGQGKSLDELSIDEYKALSPAFEGDVFGAISMEACVNGRAIVGGPAFETVRRAIENAKASLAQK